MELKQHPVVYVPDKTFIQADYLSEMEIGIHIEQMERLCDTGHLNKEHPHSFVKKEYNLVTAECFRPIPLVYILTSEELKKLIGDAFEEGFFHSNKEARKHRGSTIMNNIVESDKETFINNLKIN